MSTNCPALMAINL